MIRYVWKIISDFVIWTLWFAWKRAVPEVVVVAATGAARIHRHPPRRPAEDHQTEGRKISRVYPNCLFLNFSPKGVSVENEELKRWTDTADKIDKKKRNLKMTKRRMVDDTSKNSLKIAQRTEEDTLEIDRRPD